MLFFVIKFVLKKLNLFGVNLNFETVTELSLKLNFGKAKIEMHDLKTVFVLGKLHNNANC